MRANLRASTSEDPLQRKDPVRMQAKEGQSYYRIEIGSVL